MSTIDERISGAMSDDDRAFLASLDEERGLFEQVGDTLTGPLAGWSRLIFVVAFGLGITLIYSAWRFFTASGGDDLLFWGLITLGILMMQGFIKEWFYNRMNMIAILRELKRLQLQIAMSQDGEP
ncbi:hypothetical protein BPTFM16_01212 [Altererythrobacter insulae]|nr:hypothetical protein BPTFM16_01212 [Altererythrobacter insulae]